MLLTLTLYGIPCTLYTLKCWNGLDFISAPFDGGINPTFSKLSWKGDTPFRTALEFQIRTAPTRQQLDNRPWQGPNGPKSFYQKSPAVLDSFPKRFRWIQYKASLISPASANSPVLRSVSISFNWCTISWKYRVVIDGMGFKIVVFGRKAGENFEWCQ